MFFESDFTFTTVPRALPTLSSFKKNIRKLDLDILMDNCCANCI